MVNLFADPPQGRDASQQLRTTGRFSIAFISPPQGLGISDIPTSPENAWIDDFGALFVDDLGNNVVFDL